MASETVCNKRQEIKNRDFLPLFAECAGVGKLGKARLQEKDTEIIGIFRVALSLPGHNPYAGSVCFATLRQDAPKTATGDYPPAAVIDHKE